MFDPIESISSGTISDDNKVVFSFTPQPGVTFTPTNIALEALRYGTGGGYLDMYFITESGTTTLATSVNPNRNGTANSSSTSYLSYDIEGASGTSEAVQFVIYIHNLNNGKQVGLANIVISGTYEGYPEEVATYTIGTACQPAAAGTITQSPIGTSFNTGTNVTLSAENNFGYSFVNWTDAEGNILSTDASFTHTLQSDIEITANFEELTTYSFDLTVDGAPSYMISFSDEGTTVSGQRMYEAGTEVALTASNNAVYTFTNWSDGTTSTTKTLTINDNSELTAVYNNVGFICGWDFYNAGSSERAGDIYNESTNQGKLSLRNASGSTNSWLDRSALSSNPLYEGRYGIVNWKTFGEYYYEASFSTTNYYNIHVLSGMLLSYNGYSVQRLEYSTDGENFTLVGEINIAQTKTWYDTDFELPEDASNVSKLYVRWIPDYESDVIGTTSTADGTAISAIFILADQVLADDYDAPELKSSVPAEGATNVTASGSIVLNFNEVVKAGEGDVTIGDVVLTDATFSGSSVLYRYNNLDYNTTYTVTVPAGAIVDRSGNAFEGTTLTFTTMDRNQPDARLYDAVVAADGSGDYLTVIEAIEAAPTGRTSPWLIFVKAGYYKGHVEIPTTKPYIYLIGEDKETVTITDELLCGGDNAVHVSLGATVVAKASDFYAEGISFENEYGVQQNAGPQALAMYTNNDRACFYNCKLRSYQDTYLTSTNSLTDLHYLKDCFIEGAVDFIYGAGDVYFDECTINIVRTSGGYIVAPNHPTGTAWGYVFDHNTITAPTTPASSTSVWLGRPWHNACKTVFLYTTAEVTIPAAGWYETMGTIPEIFADYKTMDADGNLLDLSNRIDTYYYTDDDGTVVYGTAKNSLTDEEAAEYTYTNVLSGSDYWNPREIMEAVNAPANLSIVEGVMSWEAVQYAMCYVVLKNGAALDFTTDCTYTIADYSESDTYTVRAANEYGSLGAKAAIESNDEAEPEQDGPVGRQDDEQSNSVAQISTGGLSIVAIYNTAGQQLSSLHPGICLLRLSDGTVQKVLVK